MFTGIIQCRRQIRRLEPRGGDVRLTIATGKLALTDVRLGDSIAVNGVCLTAVELPGDGFAADVSRETLSLHHPRRAEPGSPVNLEKALTPTTRLGGHLVSGHVDGIGEVAEARRMPAPGGCASRRRTSWPATSPRKAPSAWTASASPSTGGRRRFELNIVPHTLAETTIGDYRPARGSIWRWT